MQIVKWTAIIIAVHDIWSLLALVTLVAGEVLMRYVKHPRK